MLIDVEKQPTHSQRIKRKCHKCNEISDSMYFNHVNSVNIQSKYCSYWHCRKCYHALDLYRKHASTTTSEAMKKKFKEDKEYVRKVTVARSKYYKDSSENPRTWSTEKVVSKFKEIHGAKYDYSKVVCKNFSIKVEVVCPKHGSWFVRPSHHIHFGNGCPQCNNEKTISKAEVELVEKIRTFYDGEILQSDRKILNGLEIDILIPEFKLGIEYHGAYFHSFNRIETSYQRNYHSMKSSMAYRAGYNLLQFVDLDYKIRPQVAMSMIRNKMNMSNRIHARKCSIERIDYHVAKEFLDNNHYEGNVDSTIYIGLVCDGTLFSVLSLIQRKDFVEIGRFATLIDHVVVGGFSKLFSWVKKEFEDKTIMTYVDRCFTTNESCYSKSGMKFNGITKPGYRYLYNNILFSRQLFQKHKLEDALEKFNPELTEAENMFQNGYLRLWDAGNLRFIC